MAITQFSFGLVMPDQPVRLFVATTSETEVPSASNQQTTMTAPGTYQHQPICRVSTDTAVYVSFGSNPNAGTDTNRIYMPANAVEYFPCIAGDKGAVINA